MMRRYPCLLLGPFLLGTAACAADSVSGPQAAPEAIVANDLKAFEEPHEDGTVILYRGGTPVVAVPPLVIVDGAEWTQPLERLAELDIASIEVRKGAAAAPVYGPRGERGVIVVTTRAKALPGSETP
jgi:TonB-dependent SusC/RagA subfamily outer membrane receptor